jgi:hypothetical protein
LYDRANASIDAALRVKRTLRRLDPVGEKQNQPFQLSFNPSLKVDFQGSRVTSDSRQVLVRELTQLWRVDRLSRLSEPSADIAE